MKDVIYTKGILPAITLYQPWASWIIRGWKTIETRTHSRFGSLLGERILIHSGQKTDTNAANNPYLTREQIMHKPDEIINGYILGSALVYNFCKLTDSDSRRALIECNTERWGLFLCDIEVFKPIPCKGEMGIWYYDFDNKCKVKKPQAQQKLF